MYAELSAFQVCQEEFKGLAHGWEGDFIPGDFLGGEEPGFQRFLSGAKLAIDQAGPVKHMYLVDVRHVDDGVKAVDVHFCQRFFPGFACRRFDGGFGVLHKSCWQRPIAIAGFDGPATKQNPAFPDGYGPRHNFGVLVVYGFAADTDVAVAVITFRNSLFDRMAACAAILHYFPRILRALVISLTIPAVHVSFNVGMLSE